MLPQIVTIVTIKNGLYQDWRHHLVPSGNYTNQRQLPWGAKFKFFLNVNLHYFIIEHTTETKILLLVPLDHRTILQGHWANLKTPYTAFNCCLHTSLGCLLGSDGRISTWTLQDVDDVLPTSATVRGDR
jgi:hypothetical protein